MGKKVAILQSNYIPWKGYFDLINQVDEFILYDNAQYTKNDWRNRNKIKTPNGAIWLTIPVAVNSLHQTIRETKIASNNWNIKHIKSIKQNYSKANSYKLHIDFFEDLYNKCNFKYLSEINYFFIIAINNFLGINTKILWAHNFPLVDGKTNRLVDLCLQAGATEYISGPAAKNYLNESLFNKENIKVSWMDYSNYIEYEQLYPPFDRYVSIVDLILNTGEQIKR